MRLFVTGASGFVGSFVVRSLLKDSHHDVAVLLREPQKAWRVQDLLSNVYVVKGELENIRLLECQLASFKPEGVVHLAWDGVSGSNRNDISQWRNIPQTLELVELASRVGARHWIGLGSQAEYGPCSNKIDETRPTQPTTLYGKSKLSAYSLSDHVCEELGIRHAWLRLFSSFGPTDNPYWMIPYLAKKLLKGEVPSLTQAEQRWDYVYIEDVASAIKAVVETPSAEGVFNLGSGKSIKLRTIIETIRDLIDPNLPLGFGWEPYRPDQVMHLEADIGRLTASTGWRPKADFNEAIRETVSWYSRNR